MSPVQAHLDFWHAYFMLKEHSWVQACPQERLTWVIRHSLETQILLVQTSQLFDPVNQLQLGIGPDCRSSCLCLAVTLRSHINPLKLLVGFMSQQMSQRDISGISSTSALTTWLLLHQFHVAELAIQ